MAADVVLFVPWWICAGALVLLAGLAMRRTTDKAQVALILGGVAAGQLGMFAAMVARHPPIYEWLDHRLWYYPLPFQALLVVAIVAGLDTLTAGWKSVRVLLLNIALIVLVIGNVVRWDDHLRTMQRSRWCPTVYLQTYLLKSSLRDGAPIGSMNEEYFGFYRGPYGLVWRTVPQLTALAILGVYASQLLVAVDGWHTMASVSRRAVIDLEREVLAAPEDSLVLVGVPASSWAWALPFAARPPYTGADLTTRAILISPPQLHCCSAQWHEETLRLLRQWSAQPGREAIALHWHPQTGALSRLTGRQNPDLRTLVAILQDLNTPEALDRNIQAFLNQVVARPMAR
jgi:hypothetical protein